MSRDRSEAVDTYFAQLFIGEDADLSRALAASAAAGLPPIAVSAVQGKLLYLLACAIGARRILEVGTLGGYSAIWLARALPSDGRLITCEIDPVHAEVARASIAAAGFADIVTIEVAPALQTLDRFVRDGIEAFDLVFIDADKQNNPNYLARAVELAHPGTMIVLDNVVRGGAVIDESSKDSAVVGTRNALEMLVGDPRLDATAIQMVGQKGYDGFALARVV